MLAKAEVVAGRLAEVAAAVRHHRAVVGHKADVGFLDLGEEAVRSEGDVSVVEAVVNAVDGKLTAGSTWELGGPEVLSFKQCLEKMLPLIERKPVFISLPFAVARTFARLLQYLPGAPLTPGQVDLLKTDNIVSQDAADEGRTLAGAGVQATSMMSVLPDYLVRFRKHGEFQANRGL